MNDSERRPSDQKFFEDMAHFFASFIFEKTGVDIDAEISPDELKAAI